MAKYKAYSEYKDSGVEWLGEIPAHWNIKRLGQFFEERREKVSDKDYPALSVTMQGIIPQLDTAAKTEAGDNRKLVLKDDFVINSRSDRKGSAGVSRFNGSVSLISIVMRPMGINPRFAHYLLRCRPFQEEFYRYGKGIVADLWSTNSSELKNIHLPEIQFSESEKITIFLDHETAKIDNLIEKQHQLIELLKEKRHAVISHVVTKGLNPDVPMKDSGVEWVGEMPSYWRISKLRYMFNFGKGLTITKENLQDEGIPCISYGEVHSKYGFEVSPKLHSLKCVDEKYLKDNSGSLLSKGDIIFADTSEDIDSSGNFSQLITDDIVFAGYHTIIAKPFNRKNWRFYAYLLDCKELRTQVRHAVKGVKVFSITQAILRGLSIWLPTDDEQENIAKFLDHETTKIDNLIEKQQQIIQLLQERRTALISAAVTGKIDVRNWVAPGEQAKAESPAEAFA
ncbi:restriction endonuclease subunit S [Citrobacter braakii]|uniref:restriction endonuclease subunit S n=1 Tax=Citrobacter braakii TaxID=57706 RepID=UPI003975F260